MCKVGVGMSRRGTIIQHIAFTGHRLGAIAAAWEELGLAEGSLALGFGVVLGLLGAIGGTVDAEKVLQLLGEVAVAIDVLVAR